MVSPDRQLRHRSDSPCSPQNRHPRHRPLLPRAGRLAKFHRIPPNSMKFRQIPPRFRYKSLITNRSVDNISLEFSPKNFTRICILHFSGNVRPSHSRLAAKIGALPTRPQDTPFHPSPHAPQGRGKKVHPFPFPNTSRLHPLLRLLKASRLVMSTHSP